MTNLSAPAAALAALAVAALALPALGAFPAPTKPVATSFFSGRWYEIARSPNSQQRDCEAPTYQFAPKTAEALAFTLTCHKGSPGGKADALNVTLHLPTDEARNRFRVTALAGLAKVDYWVLDRADDGDWWILATPKTARIWLLARKPELTAGERGEALERMRALGYDVGRLEFPKQG